MSFLSQQRFLYVGALALALGSAHCGGRPPEPANGGSNQPAGGNNQAGGGTDKLIDDLLGDLGGGGAQTKPADGTHTIAPAGPAGGTGGGGSGGKLDTFDEDVARIRQLVPSWDNGVGASVKFLRESDGQRLSLIYVDPTPPVLKDGVGLWMIQAKATSGDKVLGWFVVLLKDLAPGRYSGSPQNKDVIMSALMAPDWDGKNPETTWSINDGSWCEITLRPGNAPGDLQGEFRGKLVDNKGTGYHTIETGYIYINR